MKFLYEYRTPDNAKHNGVICASDREAAYAALKKQGIKPSRFSEAPGVFNKVFGKGKRWIAIGVLGVLVVAAAFVIQSNNRTIRSIEQTQNVFDSPTRRQVIGDAAVIDKGIRTGWSDVFELEGDRFLASFAIPGVPAAIRSTTDAEINKALCASRTEPRNPSSLEERQIRAMVDGIKQELREFIADGGTVKQYGRRLVQRQEEEIAYYRRAKNDVDNAVKNKRDAASVFRLLDKYNASLRQMGIRLLVMPE